MAEPDKRPVTMEELLVSSLAQTDALAKLLIEKGLITRGAGYFAYDPFGICVRQPVPARFCGARCIALQDLGLSLVTFPLGKSAWPWATLISLNLFIIYHTKVEPFFTASANKHHRYYQNQRLQCCWMVVQKPGQ